MTINEQISKYKNKSANTKMFAGRAKAKLEKVEKAVEVGNSALKKLKQRQLLHGIAGILGVVGFWAGVATLNIPLIVLATGCSMINGAMLYDTHKSFKSVENTLKNCIDAQQQMSLYATDLEDIANLYAKSAQELQKVAEAETCEVEVKQTQAKYSQMLYEAKDAMFIPNQKGNDWAQACEFMSDIIER
ncbi:MAG: hypothetical protein IJA69_01035 [Clostridia bacterium]|nr:hypothetical protein [Clostridia bacterium]